MILCFVNTSRWGTLLSTGSASAVQTRHQTSADTHCPHGGQTPGQTHTHKNTVYTRFVIKILKSSVLQTSTQDACQGIIGLSDLYYIFRSADIPPCLPQKKTEADGYPLSPQGPLGVWRSGHGRKASRKPLSSDLSVGEAGNRKSRGRLEFSEPRVNSSHDRNLTFVLQRSTTFKSSASWSSFVWEFRQLAAQNMQSWVKHPALRCRS